ncbi:hypothetical protein SAMD00019534_061900 [Acytostelium subglobosum LB1]|uniref:hypothetical protein n=1 Tax=Acytostelium subglobosum LB1 TaxID=1410327 RepID=UPI00064499CF|nr:hypothetical protein SAMD00019534_061900 [Acytostelium subglobosum LB1]GAM23015.1 hypothetical protein SAMD00019534_061900 [Acytostelium subglobosum LB1]|eukprot:XP_012754242.1 hypothetical protein SAMD00019534_061900 [Acytostelium subglobosum LB1]
MAAYTQPKANVAKLLELANEIRDKATLGVFDLEKINEVSSDNEYLKCMLQSVTYTDTRMKIKHFYGGCDDGMGQKEEYHIQGSFINVHGKIIEFKFFAIGVVEGGHSDHYYHNHDSRLVVGEYKHMLQKHVYDESEISELKAALFKIINDVDHSDKAQQYNARLSDADIKQFFKMILPSTFWKSPYFSLDYDWDGYNVHHNDDDESMNDSDN